VERPSSSLFALIVDRPVAVLMIFTAVAVFGQVSFLQLPVNLMPDLSYPTLTVRTEYPGAAPEEVEAQISRPVEEAVSTADGLVRLESRSRAESSDVVLEFGWGADMNQAAQSVRERLQQTFLPDEARRPLLLRYDPSLDPILRVALALDPSADGGPEGEAALLMLREVAEDTLKPRLEAMDGVAAVKVRGGLERQILVEVREDWLAARRLTLEQVRGALATENVNIAGGAIREGDTEYLIRTLNEFSRIDELQALQIRRSDGQLVRLDEVAEIHEAHKDREVVSHLDGQEAVELEVHKEADANIVSVARAVKERLGVDAAPVQTVPEGMPRGPPTLAEQLPEFLSLKVLDDQAAFIEAAVSNLGATAALGGLLAISVLFLFLRDLRATAIIGTAIPISIVCTFAPLYLFDVSLNLMSLGGLALGIGMLVDNAVVVLESIHVQGEQGASRRDAAEAGVREVAAAVVASTLTTVAVFLPIAYVEGIAGQLFRDLALAVVCSLLASLLVALVFVPMLAARRVPIPRVGATDARAFPVRFGSWPQLKASVAWDKERAWRWVMLPYQAVRFLIRGLLELLVLLLVVPLLYLGRVLFLVAGVVLPRLHGGALWVAERFGTLYDRLDRRYPAALTWALRSPATVLGWAIVLLTASVYGATTVGTELIPEVHQGRFTVEAALPVGTPLDRTVSVLAEVEETLADHPEIASVYAAIGSERRADARPDEGEHTARLLVQLAGSGDLAERQDRVMAEVRDTLATLPRLTTRLRTPALFSFRTPVEVVVVGQDLDALRASADQVQQLTADQPGLNDVRSSLVSGFPEIRVRYDRRLLDRFGLGAAAVAESVRDKVQGAEATRVRRGDRKVDLFVRLVEDDRESVAQLGRINVNPSLDPPIPLNAVATLEEGIGPSEIRRIDQQRAAVVSANVVGFDLGTSGAALSAALDGLSLPDGVHIEVAGQSREMARSLGSLTFALGLAIFLVYVIMASTFEHLLHPLVILFSLPLAAVGVVLGLIGTGTPLSVVVFIGLIVLAGVVVNNAIVLVDTINRQRSQLSALAAIERAGRLRLRPILITTVTTVLGLLPLALGLGEGAEIQQPLALTLIAGLTSATLLTLVVIPVVYKLVNRVGAADRLPAGAAEGSA